MALLTHVIVALGYPPGLTDDMVTQAMDDVYAKDRTGVLDCDIAASIGEGSLEFELLINTANTAKATTRAIAIADTIIGGAVRRVDVDQFDEDDA